MQASKFLVICACLWTFGCVTSGDYEDLEHRVALEKLETANMQHERDQLASDVKALKAENRRLERRLHEKQAELQEQQQAAVSDHAAQTQLQADLLSAKTEVTRLRNVIVDLRNQLVSGTLNTKVARQKAAFELDAKTISH